MGPEPPASMAPRTAFHRWAMSWAWRRQKSLMARWRSAAKSVRNRRMLKQVTTLPWHFTPEGALYGPIYGIYVG